MMTHRYQHECATDPSLSGAPLHVRLCRNTVHGSRASPRTDGTPKIKALAVRPEVLEGRTADCDTVSVRMKLDLTGGKISLKELRDLRPERIQPYG